CNGCLYNVSQLDRVFEHLERIISAALADPSVAALSVNLLSEAEQRQLLEEYSDTPIACSPDITLPDLFSRQVSVMPDSTVVVYGDQRFSYGELDELSTRLACYLRQEYRIGRDDKVAIMLERTPLLIVAILGVLKAGAAYVPLDADYPRARKSFILEDTGSPVLITQAGNLFDL